MMDGCIGVICKVLDVVEYFDVGIFVYFVKYVLVYYGLFWDVLDFVLKFGDKKIY